MKLHCFIIIILLVAVSATGFAQRRDSLNWGDKQRWIYPIGKLNKDSVSIEGDVYGRFQYDLLIGEFRIRHLNTDSLLIDQLHNEGAVYLLWSDGSGRLVLTLFDITQKNGQFVYPDYFRQTVIDMQGEKIRTYESKIEAGNMMEFYGRIFSKKLRELF